MVKSVLVRIILIERIEGLKIRIERIEGLKIRIERIEGSGPIYRISFLKFSKMFLRISMDAIYNCNRLDLHSD